MRVASVIIAWFGLLVILLFLPFSFSSSWTLVNTGTLGSGVGFFFTMCTSAVGAVLLLIGGFVSKAYYFWIICVVIGIIHISSYYAYLFDITEPNRNWTLLIELLPGIACIAGGIAMKILDKRRKVSH